LRALLKSYNLPDNAIRIYTEYVGKVPFTFNEIKKFMSKQSEEEINQTLDELINKKLLLHVKPQYSKSLTHYILIPPFAAILNSLTELTKISEDSQSQKDNQKPKFEEFQDNLFEDIENISQGLIDVISSQASSNQAIDILSEVEQNVKKFAQVILSDIIKIISPLKNRSGVDTRDIIELLNSVKNKVSESEAIVENMFTQFREIVEGMTSPDIHPQVEAFKTFIRKLGESIEKRIQEIPREPPMHSLIPTDSLGTIENSLYNILTDYISKHNIPSEKIWPVSNIEKIQEILNSLIDECKEELIIIVPKIENFIPLDKLQLDYSTDLTLKSSSSTSPDVKIKKPIRKKPAISKKQRQEFEDKLNTTSKKVSELKGFELSHNVAEILSMISDINSESIVIESIQGWLNRLLVIRKLLDSDTQYLLLESIEKWKKNYIKKVEIPLEEELSEEELKENNLEKLSLEKGIKKKITPEGLQIKIVSSEPHDNKHILAIKKKTNYQYLMKIKNNLIGILGDNSYLIFGILQRIEQKPFYEITGFYTTYKPLIESYIPIISRIYSKAKPSKETQINRGFNEIIENINDYSGKEIGKKLSNLLDVAFEKDGISLNILELRLLVGKLEKIYTPLPDEMKEHIVEELNRFNAEFSTLELTPSPEFRPPLVEEEIQESSAELLEPEDFKVEPVDPEKISNLFDIFLEKIGELKGVEIIDQIDKFIEVILKLQGYSQITKWKKNLQDAQEPLDDTIREKFKNDFLRWKWGILNQVPSTKAPVGEDPLENFTPSQSIELKEEDAASIFEEEYISPGLSQSQFASDTLEETVIEENLDPDLEMKNEFDQIENNFSELNGVDISRKLQNIVDIILETRGYSLELKDIKDWITKLRKIKKPLDSDIKEEFVITFFQWKEKFV
jgi:hypothetical protein